MIKTLHRSYSHGVALAQRVRDFEAGEDAVKAMGEYYLPKLGGQSKEEYEAYKSRGFLVPAVSPTAKAVSGAIMRKQPVMSTSLKDISDNIDGEGNDIEVLVGNMIHELLIAGAAGYLVEYDEQLERNVVKQYTRENIINVSDSFIVLRQFYEVPDEKNPYKMNEAEEFVELTYDENGMYIQRVWREYNGEWMVIDTVQPTKRGTPFDYLPFVFCTEGRSLWDSKPILLNLANVNLDQYRLSTDQRHGLHWTALPTLFLFGDLTDENGMKKQLKIGAGTANHIQDSDARAELLEFSGAGLGAIENAVRENITTMAAIGAKMLTSETSGVKAAETARIEASSETATLSGIANEIDSAMQQLLEIIADWSQKPSGEFLINRDFIDVKMEPAKLMALLKTWQSGGMSLDSFLYQLERGELLPDGITAELEAGRIETTGRDFVDFDEDDDDEGEGEDEDEDDIDENEE